MLTIYNQNQIHPSLHKINHKISSTSLPLLNVLVGVTDTGNMTSLCRKPTDLHTYHMYSSFHPHHIKSSIVLSQLIRLKRVCSNISDYEHDLKILTQSILSRAVRTNYFLNKSTACRISHDPNPCHVIPTKKRMKIASLSLHSSIHQ